MWSCEDALLHIPSLRQLRSPRALSGCFDAWTLGNSATTFQAWEHNMERSQLKRKTTTKSNKHSNVTRSAKVNKNWKRPGYVRLPVVVFNTWNRETVPCFSLTKQSSLLVLHGTYHCPPPLHNGCCPIWCVGVDGPMAEVWRKSAFCLWSIKKYGNAAGMLQKLLRSEENVPQNHRLS